jgi:ABC-type molybdate transport system substrate-binding protein
VIWDATAHQYDAIDLLRVDLFEAAPRTIAIGVADATPQSQEALKFARFLASPEHGGAAFTRWGYEPLDGDPFVDRPSILLFAGTMFNSAIEETVQAFEAREGVEVKRVYNGCGMLVAQMQSGATPDAYLACDQSFLDAIQTRFHGGYLISQNPMVLAVAKGNPKAIKTLDDLAREGVRVGLAHPEKSALGSLSLALLEDEGLRARIDAAETQVQDSPQGDFLINALRTGAIDSAIVYLSNASMSRDEIDIIAIDSPLAHSTQPYAIARSTDAHQVMKRLLEAITTNESRARFEALGFDWGAQQ